MGAGAGVAGVAEGVVVEPVVEPVSALVVVLDVAESVEDDDADVDADVVDDFLPWCMIFGACSMTSPARSTPPTARTMICWRRLAPAAAAFTFVAITVSLLLRRC